MKRIVTLVVASAIAVALAASGGNGAQAATRCKPGGVCISPVEKPTHVHSYYWDRAIKHGK